MKTMKLKDIYNEYYGLEQFKNKPISGGFHAIDQKYKPKQWREAGKFGWKTSDQGFFSRVKRVCEALRAVVNKDGGDWSSEYDDVLRRKGLLGVVNKMQDDGVLALGAARAPKRARTS